MAKLPDRDLTLPEIVEWIASRPESIRRMIEALPPDRLYRMASGSRCTLYSYNEDGTVQVEVTGQYNRVLFSRRVFGINPDELVECELPSPGEDWGDTMAEAGFTEEDKTAFIREHFHPCDTPGCTCERHGAD
jgi:hypothetical protein